MIERLVNQLAPFKQQLIEHKLYQNIETIPALRCFMETHVYAVWDFMSLVKKLALIAIGFSQMTCFPRNLH